MSVVLWPRQEVLQLVIPQLSAIGKGLHLSTIGEISRRLLELRNTDGKIRYVLTLRFVLVSSSPLTPILSFVLQFTSLVDCSKIGSKMERSIDLSVLGRVDPRGALLES